MELNALTAVSPIDGRYRSKTKDLASYFSEYALIKYRVRVEIEYFITLCELPLPQLKSFDHSLFERLRDIYRNFSEADAQRVKDIEKVTNHDVKAVEYFIKEKFDEIEKLPTVNCQGIHSLWIDQSGHQQYIGAALHQGGVGRSLLPSGGGTHCTAQRVC